MISSEKPSQTQFQTDPPMATGDTLEQAAGWQNKLGERTFEEDQKIAEESQPNGREKNPHR